MKGGKKWIICGEVYILPYAYLLNASKLDEYFRRSTKDEFILIGVFNVSQKETQ